MRAPRESRDHGQATHASTVTLVAPNGLRLSGARKGVRCSRGLGASITFHGKKLDKSIALLDNAGHPLRDRVPANPIEALD